MQQTLKTLMLTAGLLSSTLIAANTDVQTEALYQEHCASCHGSDRLGGTGPALLPENLARLKNDQAEDAIRNGRPAGNCSFG